MYNKTEKQKQLNKTNYQTFNLFSKALDPLLAHFTCTMESFH